MAKQRRGALEGLPPEQSEPLAARLDRMIELLDELVVLELTRASAPVPEHAPPGAIRLREHAKRGES